MTNIDISSEITFKTARSGGKGGQNVNKVETMVEGRWSLPDSSLLSDTQKKLLLQKLGGKLTKDQVLLVKSQTERTQLGNKGLVIQKMNAILKQALVRKKSRIATQPTKASRQHRLEGKKIQSYKKQLRARPEID